MDAASRHLLSHKIKTAEEVRAAIGARPRKKKVIMCHGTFDVVKANTWNSTERWVRVHSDKRNDPWLEMDVDLYPGGNYVLLKDEFTVWRDMLGHFTKYINFGK